MAESAASTAYGVMAQIALERAQHPARRIFDDPLAVHMLPPAQQAMVMFMGIGLLRKPVVGLLEKFAPGIASGILSRKRYIDDQVNEALEDGIKTIVMLGAGLDTLAYRNLQLASASIRVYEVDQAEIIAYKTEKVRQIYQKLPAHVTYVPIDFETQELGAVLKTAGYSFDQPGLFVWEGVTQYLSEAGVRGTLQSLRQAAPGSRLVFTYVRKDFIDGVNKYGLESFYQRVRVKNQLWQFGLAPEAIEEFIGEYGWEVIEQVGADEYRQRYLQPAGRNDAISELERAVYAEKTMG